MPTFQKEESTEKKTTERIKRIGRASGMTKKELDKLKNNRKEEGSRSWSPEDFRDMEFREVTRKELRKRSEYIRSTEVRNNLVQNRGERIQVVGSDVEALYPSLEAVEVAQIVYQAILETDVKFVGVDYQEACRMIALTSTEQECCLGPLRNVIPKRRYVKGTRPGITGADPLGPEVGSQDQ